MADDSLTLKVGPEKATEMIVYFYDNHLKQKHGVRNGVIEYIYEHHRIIYRYEESCASNCAYWFDMSECDDGTKMKALMILA